MNNEIIKSGNDFEVRKPLSFEQFKDRYDKSAITDELVEQFKNWHGMDLMVEVESILKNEYDLYLERFAIGLE